MIEALGQHSPASTALVEPAAARCVSYGELNELVQVTGQTLRGLGKGCLAFLLAEPTIEALVLYLSCLAERIPVVLLDPAHKPESFRRLLDAYLPQVLLLPNRLAVPTNFRLAVRVGESYVALVADTPAPTVTVHPDLAVLLATSGSTGDAKLVRLSRRNLLANAASIVAYLGLNPDARAIQSLPVPYSYGLSVINSHLVAGASIVLTSHSFMRPEFWDVFGVERCTSFAGVPFMYETLHRLQFDPLAHPTLRTLTQAGGPLKTELMRAIYERAAGCGVDFYVMYGQTEATARIAYVPPHRLGEKIGAIGIAIPHGRLQLADESESDGSAELVYSGANVMLGYAVNCDSLAEGDTQNGVLRTGDLGRQDDEGFFFLTGRLKRIAKLQGRRVNLADVESDVESHFSVLAAAVDRGDRLHVAIEAVHPVDLNRVQWHVCQRIGVPPRYVRTQQLVALPRTAAGKKDYHALQS